jgi:tRNA nucleotidyltransferase/poly(A) polymerase
MGSSPCFSFLGYTEGMNRYEILYARVMNQYAVISYVPLRQEAIAYTIRVLDASLYAGGDELDQAAALCHDLARFLNNSVLHHAEKSAEMARPLLLEAGYDPMEADLICTAISRHSMKDIIQNPRDEHLKKADIAARLLEKPDSSLLLQFTMESSKDR